MAAACECGHPKDGHLANGCVDWDARNKRRCTCTEYKPAPEQEPVRRTGFVPKEFRSGVLEVLPEPTLEQCENAAVALGFPILIEGLRPPYYEESMRNLHRLIQRAVLGDEDAAATLAHLRAAFGRDIMRDDEA